MEKRHQMFLMSADLREVLARLSKKASEQQKSQEAPAVAERKEKVIQE